MDKVDTENTAEQIQEEMRKKREQADREMIEKLKHNMGDIKHKIFISYFIVMYPIWFSYSNKTFGAL